MSTKPADRPQAPPVAAPAPRPSRAPLYIRDGKLVLVLDLPEIRDLSPMGVSARANSAACVPL